LLVILSLSLTSCDKGLAPPSKGKGGIHFPVTPQGGNPMGSWEPDSVNAVEVTFLTQIPADSIHFETSCNGFFSFEQSFICSVFVALSFRPIIFDQGDTLPVDISVSDTIQGQGAFEIFDEKVLFLPLESHNFNLDTLGFTAEVDRLALITLPNTYTYAGFLKFDFFLILNLIRIQEGESLPVF